MPSGTHGCPALRSPCGPVAGRFLRRGILTMPKYCTSIALLCVLSEINLTQSCGCTCGRKCNRNDFRSSRDHPASQHPAAAAGFAGMARARAMRQHTSPRALVRTAGLPHQASEPVLPRAAGRPRRSSVHSGTLSPIRHISFEAEFHAHAPRPAPQHPCALLRSEPPAAGSERARWRLPAP